MIVPASAHTIRRGPLRPHGKGVAFRCSIPCDNTQDVKISRDAWRRGRTSGRLARGMAGFEPFVMRSPRLRVGLGGVQAPRSTCA